MRKRGAEMGTGTGTEKRKTGRPKGSKSGYTMSEKALAQRKNAGQDMIKSRAPYEGEDIAYNARQIDHVIAIQEIASHADRKDPVSLRSCFLNYLRLCQQDGFKVGNMAAYAAMGVDHVTVIGWERGTRQEYKDLAKFVKSTCALFRENMIADQKINPVIGIFWQRNFDGLRNDTEQQQTQNEIDLSETMTTDDYKQKYGKLIDE